MEKFRFSTSNVTLNKAEVEKAISLKIYKIYQEKLKMINCVDFGI